MSLTDVLNVIPVYVFVVFGNEGVVYLVVRLSTEKTLIPLGSYTNNQ